jgi:hypothetical protein
MPSHSRGKRVARFTFLVLLTRWNGAAQPPIEGTATSQDGRALEGASVTLETRANGVRITSTDREGHYSLRGLDPGNYGLVFEYEGYARLIKLVNLTFDDDSGDVDVKLAKAKPAWRKRITSKVAKWLRSGRPKPAAGAKHLEQERLQRNSCIRRAGSMLDRMIVAHLSVKAEANNRGNPPRRAHFGRGPLGFSGWGACLPAGGEDAQTLGGVLAMPSAAPGN